MSRVSRVFCFVAALACSAAWPAPARGQDGSPSVSIQAVIGPGWARTSSTEYRNDGSGLTLDALAAASVLPLRNGAMLMAMSANTQGTLSMTADCQLTPDGGCAPWYPQFEALSFLVGWRSAGDQVRLLTGPSLAIADSRVAGWQARIDLATRRIWGMSAVLSARTLVVPRYDGASFQTYSLGIGLRASAF